MKSRTSTQIIVGLSGGVDSSVSAYLLKEAGYSLEGVFMKNWEGNDTDEYCSAATDMADAEKVCKTLAIPFHVVNFADCYWERVFAHFLAEYRAGRTPNPDILCNKEIKFRAFLDYAKNRGADFIATGHYVRRSNDSKHPQLLKGLDPDKDQSYFLHALDEQQLAHSLFPIGEMKKTEVRDLAKKLGFTNHAKKDSTGICFIGERKFKTFLSDYLPAKPGNIETLDGDVIGRHDGLMFYTLGQRQGLQIGGLKGKDESPWYVAKKCLARNVLTVVQGEDHPALFTRSLTAQGIHWINGQTAFPLIAKAKTRYRQPDQPCLIDRIEDGRCEVIFDQPQRSVTPGQSVVFYQGDQCLGGGVIE